MTDLQRHGLAGLFGVGGVLGAVFEGLAIMAGSVAGGITMGVFAAGMSLGYARALHSIRSESARRASHADLRAGLSLAYFSMSLVIIVAGEERNPPPPTVWAAALVAANIPFLWWGTWRSKPPVP